MTDIPLSQSEAIAALEAAHGNLEETLNVLGKLDVGVTIPEETLIESLSSMSTKLEGKTSGSMASLFWTARGGKLLCDARRHMSQRVHFFLSKRPMQYAENMLARFNLQEIK